MRHLNSISEEALLSGVSCLRDTVTQLLAKPPANDDLSRQSFHERLGQVNMELGLYLYALESPTTEIRPFMVTAAASFVEALILRPKPEANVCYNPWQAHMWLSVVITFGSAADRIRMSKLQEHQYRSPIRKDNEAIAHFVAHVVAHLGGRQATDVASLDQIIAVTAGKGRSEPDAFTQLLNAMARSLLHLQRDDATWPTTIADMARIQKSIAKHACRLLPEGLACLRALAFAKLGSERDWTVTCRSKYLPLELLGGPASGEKVTPPAAAEAMLVDVPKVRLDEVFVEGNSNEDEEEVAEELAPKSKRKRGTPRVLLAAKALRVSRKPNQRQ